MFTYLKRNTCQYRREREDTPMNEAVTKRFLLYFRLMLLVWILIVNAILHVGGL